MGFRRNCFLCYPSWAGTLILHMVITWRWKCKSCGTKPLCVATGSWNILCWQVWHTEKKHFLSADPFGASCMDPRSSSEHLNSSAVMQDRGTCSDCYALVSHWHKAVHLGLQLRVPEGEGRKRKTCCTLEQLDSVLVCRRQLVIYEAFCHNEICLFRVGLAFCC